MRPILLRAALAASCLALGGCWMSSAAAALKMAYDAANKESPVPPPPTVVPTFSVNGTVSGDGSGIAGRAPWRPQPALADEVWTWRGLDWQDLGATAALDLGKDLDITLQAVSTFLGAARLTELKPKDPAKARSKAGRFELEAIPIDSIPPGTERFVAVLAPAGGTAFASIPLPYLAPVDKDRFRLDLVVRKDKSAAAVFYPDRDADGSPDLGSRVLADTAVGADGSVGFIGWRLETPDGLLVHDIDGDGVFGEATDDLATLKAGTTEVRSAVFRGGDTPTVYTPGSGAARDPAGVERLELRLSSSLRIEGSTEPVEVLVVAPPGRAGTAFDAEVALEVPAGGGFPDAGGGGAATVSLRLTELGPGGRAQGRVLLTPPSGRGEYGIFAKLAARTAVRAHAVLRVIGKDEAISVAALDLGAAKVSAGQAAVSARVRLANDTDQAIEVEAIDLRFHDASNVDVSRYVRARPDLRGNPKTLEPRSEATFGYDLALATDAPAGIWTASVFVDGRAAGARTSGKGPAVPAAWTVQKPAALAVTGLVLPATQASHGLPVLVKATVKNTGGAPAVKLAPALAFTDAAGTADASAHFLVAPAAGNPASVEGGKEVTLAFTVTPRGSLGTFKTVRLRIEAEDGNAGPPDQGRGGAAGRPGLPLAKAAGPVSPPSWEVVRPAALEVTRVAADLPDLPGLAYGAVSRGQRAVALAIDVKNTGGAAAKGVQVAPRFLGLNDEDHSDRYFVDPDKAVTPPTVLDPGETGTWNFLVDVLVNAQLELVKLTASVGAKDSNASTTVQSVQAAKSDTWATQSAAALAIESVSVTPAEASPGRKGLAVTVDVRNTGQAEARGLAVLLDLYSGGSVVFSTRPGFTGGQAYTATLDASVPGRNPSALAGGARGTWAWTLDLGDGVSPGTVSLKAQVAGIDANTAVGPGATIGPGTAVATPRPAATDGLPSAKLVVRRPAALAAGPVQVLRDLGGNLVPLNKVRLDTKNTAGLPNAPIIALKARVTLTNEGESAALLAADAVKLRFAHLDDTDYAAGFEVPAEPSAAVSIAPGAALTVTLALDVKPKPDADPTKPVLVGATVSARDALGDSAKDLVLLVSPVPQRLDLLELPVITALDPDHGPAGRATGFVLRGTGLETTSRVELLTGATAKELPFRADNLGRDGSGNIIIQGLEVPETTPVGEHVVRVTTAAGESAGGAAATFKVEEPPSVESIADNYADRSSGAPKTVTITGKRLANVTGVRLVGRAGEIKLEPGKFSATSDTTVTAEVPAGGLAGAYSVELTTRAGTSSEAVPFYLYDGAAVLATELAPDSLESDQSLNVEVRGANLLGLSAAALVPVGGGTEVAATVIPGEFNAVASVGLRTPPPGTYQLRVTNPLAPGGVLLAPVLKVRDARLARPTGLAPGVAPNDAAKEVSIPGRRLALAKSLGLYKQTDGTLVTGGALTVGFKGNSIVIATVALGIDPGLYDLRAVTELDSVDTLSEPDPEAVFRVAAADVPIITLVTPNAKTKAGAQTFTVQGEKLDLADKLEIDLDPDNAATPAFTIQAASFGSPTATGFTFSLSADGPAGTYRLRGVKANGTTGPATSGENAVLRIPDQPRVTRLGVTAGFIDRELGLVVEGRDLYSASAVKLARASDPGNEGLKVSLTGTITVNATGDRITGLKVPASHANLVPGEYEVQVTTPFGTNLRSDLRYLARKVRVNSLATRAANRTQALDLELTGFDLDAVTKVLLRPVSTTPTTSADLDLGAPKQKTPTRLVASIPANTARAVGEYRLIAQVDGASPAIENEPNADADSDSKADARVYVTAPPEVTGLRNTPTATLTSDGGGTFTVDGDHFETFRTDGGSEKVIGAGLIPVAGGVEVAPLSFNTVSKTALEVTLEPGLANTPPGKYRVRVRTASGQAESATDKFIDVALSPPEVAFNTALAGTTQGRVVEIPMTITDPQKDRANLKVETKKAADPDTAWKTAKPATGSVGLTGLVTDPAQGNVHTFKWDAGADLPDATESVRLRVTVSDATSARAPYGIGPFTVDTLAPRPSSFEPAEGLINVAPNLPVKVNFAEALAPDTTANITAARFRVVGPDDAAVPVAVALDGTGRVVTITPDAQLASGTTYRLEVGTGLADLQGNASAASTSSSFTTAQQAKLTLDLGGLAIDTSAAADGTVVPGGQLVVRASFIHEGAGLVGELGVRLNAPAGYAFAGATPTTQTKPDPQLPIDFSWTLTAPDTWAQTDDLTATVTALPKDEFTNQPAQLVDRGPRLSIETRPDTGIVGLVKTDSASTSNTTDDLPLAGAQVKATEAGGAVVGPVATAANGTYALTAPAGTYTLEFQADEFDPATTASLAVTAAQAAQADKTLAKQAARWDDFAWADQDAVLQVNVYTDPATGKKYSERNWE